MNPPEFARLLEVSPPTVRNWERQAGNLNLQHRTLVILRKISQLTRRQAQTLLNKRKNI